MSMKEEYTAIDMARAAADGFRDGQRAAQSAGVPDVSAMARVLSDRSADACNIDRTDNWAMYGQEYIQDVQAMLAAAAPAQPAAQAEFGDAYQGAREDLAIWKRRALDAEEKLRAQCDGQSFMGEPLIQPYEAPREKIEALFKQLGFSGQVSVGEILDAALSALLAQRERGDA